MSTQKISSFDSLPDTAMIRQAQLITTPKRCGLLPFGNSTLWRKVKAGEFPKPVKLSPRVTAWKVGDVRAFLAALEGVKP